MSPRGERVGLRPLAPPGAVHRRARGGVRDRRARERVAHVRHRLVEAEGHVEERCAVGGRAARCVAGRGRGGGHVAARAGVPQADARGQPHRAGAGVPGGVRHAHVDLAALAGPPPRPGAGVSAFAARGVDAARPGRRARSGTARPASARPRRAARPGARRSSPMAIVNAVRAGSFSVFSVTRKAVASASRVTRSSTRSAALFANAVVGRVGQRAGPRREREVGGRRTGRSGPWPRRRRDRRRGSPGRGTRPRGRPWRRRRGSARPATGRCSRAAAPAAAGRTGRRARAGGRRPRLAARTRGRAPPGIGRQRQRQRAGESPCQPPAAYRLLPASIGSLDTPSTKFPTRYCGSPTSISGKAASSSPNSARSWVRASDAPMQ